MAEEHFKVSPIHALAGRGELSELELSYLRAAGVNPAMLNEIDRAAIIRLLIMHPERLANPRIGDVAALLFRFGLLESMLEGETEDEEEAEKEEKEKEEERKKREEIFMLEVQRLQQMNAGNYAMQHSLPEFYASSIASEPYWRSEPVTEHPSIEASHIEIPHVEPSRIESPSVEVVHIHALPSEAVSADTQRIEVSHVENVIVELPQAYHPRTDLADISPAVLENFVNLICVAREEFVPPPPLLVAAMEAVSEITSHNLLKLGIELDNAEHSMKPDKTPEMEHAKVKEESSTTSSSSDSSAPAPSHPANWVEAVTKPPTESDEVERR